jgi:hypothetical protein
MKIYIGGSITGRARLRSVRDSLWALGHDVTSTWLDEVLKSPHMHDDDFYRKLVIKDLCEASAAELVIIDSIDRSSTGGSDCEFGFTLGRHHRAMLWLIGPIRSVFHLIADHHFDNWDDLLNYLKVGYNEKA